MSSQPRQTFSLFNLIASLRGAATHGTASPASAAAGRSSSPTAAGSRPFSSVAAAAAASRTGGVSSPQPTATAAPSPPSGAPSASPVPRSGTASITIPIPKRRGSHGSEGSTGGYIEKPGPPLYIGGKLETGEVKFYKLGLMKAKMSDTSLDRMSL